MDCLSSTCYTCLQKDILTDITYSLWRGYIIGLEHSQVDEDELTSAELYLETLKTSNKWNGDLAVLHLVNVKKRLSKCDKNLKALFSITKQWTSFFLCHDMNEELCGSELPTNFSLIHKKNSERLLYYFVFIHTKRYAQGISQEKMTPLIKKLTYQLAKHRGRCQASSCTKSLQQ